MGGPGRWAQLLLPRTGRGLGHGTGLHEQRPGITRGDPIATGTITAPGYGRAFGERAAFIVTTIRNHLRHKRTAEDAARPDYAYRVEWLQADNEFVGLVAELPSLSWLAPTEDETLRGII